MASSRSRSFSQRPDSPTRLMVLPGHAGVGDQLLGLGRVVRIGVERIVEAEHGRAEQLTLVDRCIATEDLINDRLLVDGEVEREAHVRVGGDAFVGVENENRVFLTLRPSPPAEPGRRLAVASW